MSINKKQDKKIVKIVIVSLGVILVGGGLGPLLIDHFSAETKQENEILATEAVEEEHVLINEVNDIEIENKQTLINNEVNQNDENMLSEENQPVPPLQESDEFIVENVEPSEKSLMIPIDIITNSVVFIDNFSRGELVSRFSPLLKPSQPFTVTNIDKAIVMQVESYQRYDKYAETVSRIDVDNFISLYQRLTPLIDQAYQDIGYPKGSFNNTLNKAITEVLDTPIIRYKIKLNAASVTYKFEDENLELLPDTQKLMLRMGPDNLQKVQQKLEEIQSELQAL